MTNNFNPFDLSQYNENDFEHFIRATKQRAALMGLICGILGEEDELSLTEIKQKIITAFTLMIEMEAMVHDVIDQELTTRCVDFLITEDALEEAKTFLK